MDAKWITERMRALGLTQRCLAGKLGLTASAFNHKLHGRRPTTLVEGALLVQWLQLSAQEVSEHLLLQQKLRQAKEEEKTPRQGRCGNAA